MVPGKCPSATPTWALNSRLSGISDISTFLPRSFHGNKPLKKNTIFLVKTVETLLKHQTYSGLWHIAILWWLKKRIKQNDCANPAFSLLHLSGGADVASRVRAQLLHLWRFWFLGKFLGWNDWHITKHGGWGWMVITKKSGIDNQKWI